MGAKTKTQIAAGLRALADAFCMPFYVQRQYIFLFKQTARSLRWLEREYPNDPVAVENHVNTVHVEDLIGDLLREHRADDLEMLRPISRALVSVWSERVVPLLGSRAVRFYIGGENCETIRFHVVRAGVANWAQYDKSWKQNRTEAYEVSQAGLRRVTVTSKRA